MCSGEACPHLFTSDHQRPGTPDPRFLFFLISPHLGTPLQDGAERSATQQGKATADELKQIYSSLVGHGFQQGDIQDALKAVHPASDDAALDWLCMHVPPDRLPARFAGNTPPNILSWLTASASSGHHAHADPHRLPQHAVGHRLAQRTTVVMPSSVP